MPLTREQARLLDHRAMTEFGVPGVVLMENAGRGMAELLLRLGVNGPVGVCCGKGNNGGDGFVIARHLDNEGVMVRVLLLANPEDLAGDAAINHAILTRCRVPIDVVALDPLDEACLEKGLTGADWIVDALFGTGLAGPIRSPLDRVIATINAQPGKRFAVDIPSGLDADTGQPLGACVRANHTATVVAAKVGFAAEAAGEYVGRVHVVGMGAPRCLVQEYESR